jgi:hypothetical protein
MVSKHKPTKHKPPARAVVPSARQQGDLLMVEETSTPLLERSSGAGPSRSEQGQSHDFSIDSVIRV